MKKIICLIKENKFTTSLILMVFTLFICLVVCTGCGMKKSKNYTEVPNERFFVVKKYADDSSTYTYYIMVDKDTKFMYLITGSENTFNGLTTMLDKDGKPMVYKGDI